MGDAAKKIGMTPEAYLAFERASEIKHEFIDGEIFAMSGARRAHNLIVGNLVTALNVSLRGRCDVYPSDMKVWIPARNRYLYPDVTVACGPRFADDVEDVLVNPTVIIEVLSDSTEAYDRGDKFDQYRSLPSLAEYVLVSQSQRHVDHFTRQPEGTWLLRVHGSGSRVVFGACGGEVALDDLYVNVTGAEGAT